MPGEDLPQHGCSCRMWSLETMVTADYTLADRRKLLLEVDA